MADPPLDDASEVNHLFDALCDLSVAERVAFLDRRAVVPFVRARLERLLAHYDEASAEEDAPVGLSLLRELDPTEGRPDRVADYEILDVLGSGGMGVVYLAEQRTPHRKVALKVLRGSKRAREHVRRFQLEAELLGRLQHPGIAQIFASGTEGEGDDARAYFVMEYVDGRPLDEYVRTRRLDRTARVRLLASVADAVHHAHVRGVVHRDLKPSNVLVTAEGQVKVIDFGVARAVDREHDATQETRAGDVIGTLAYMSPEQVRGDVDAIDMRTDVYALGALAYQLLGERLPLELGDRSITAVVKLVCEEDPPPLGTVADDCKGDLEWIVAKALEKEAERRYQSAGGFSADLRRFLAHEAVEARPASAIYQLRKIARRHSAAVAGLAATLLAILVGAGVSAYYGIENARLATSEKLASDAARVSARAAMDNAQRAEEQAQLATANAANAVAARDLAEERAHDLERIADFRLEQLRFLDLSRLGRATQKALGDQLSDSVSSSGDVDGSAMRAALQSTNAVEAARQVLKEGFLDDSLAAIEREFADSPELLLKMLLAHGTLLFDLGFMPDADRTFVRALEVAAPLENARANVVHARILRAAVLVNLRRPDEAEELLAPALEEAESLDNVRDDLFDLGLRTRARIADSRGDMDTTIEVFRMTLDRARDRFEIGDERSTYGMLVALTNLSIALVRTGQLDEVEEHIDEANALLGDLGDPPPQLTLVVLNISVDWAIAVEDYELAETSAGEALALCSRVRGETDRMTLDFEWALGLVLHRREKFAEAADVLEHLLAARRAAFGEGDLEYQERLLAVASEMIDAGAPEGTRLAELALASAEAAHGTESEELLPAAELLLRAYTAAGRAEDPAVRDLEERVAQLREIGE